MENLVGFPPDFVGRVPLVQEGCFTKELFYYSGHRIDLTGFQSVRFVMGITGPETEVLSCRIIPCVVFEVAAASFAD